MDVAVPDVLQLATSAGFGGLAWWLLTRSIPAEREAARADRLKEREEARADRADERARFLATLSDLHARYREQEQMRQEHTKEILAALSKEFIDTLRQFAEERKE